MPQPQQLLAQTIGHAADSKKALMALMTEIDKTLQKSSTFTGFTRTYQPYSDDAASVAPEHNKVQTTVKKALFHLININGLGPMATAINDSLTLNKGNATVLVDVVVEGEVIFSQVPPTFLMELKKLLDGVHTMISRLPVLDPAFQWNWNDNAELNEAEPVVTIKTQKQRRVLTLAPATDKHPAQAQTYDEDVPVGTYHLRNQSGAIPLPLRTAMVQRVLTIQTAVADALAEANAKKVPVVEGGQKLVQYIFKDVLH